MDLQASMVDLASREYGMEIIASRLEGENENYLFEAPDGQKFVFKLAGPGDDPGLIDLEHLAVEAVHAVDLSLSLPRVVSSSNGNISVAYEAPGGELRRGRLLEFVPGRPWGSDVPARHDRLQQIGGIIANVHQALSVIRHPSAGRTHRWDLAAAQAQWSGVHCIAEAPRRKLLDQAFQLWSSSALPYLGKVPHGVIHGDLNDDNIFIDQGKVCGLLDFGDCLDNPLVCDLGIALAYLMLDESDPFASAAWIVEGYHRVRPLTATEVEILFPLVCGRLAVSLVISAERRRIDPERAAWFVTEERAWHALENYLQMDPVDASERLNTRIKLSVFPDRGAPAEDLLQRRKARFSGALGLSYQEPVKLIRGRGAYLMDERGWPFLDLYNNVCHVGHAHPRVVAAGTHQMAQLNTNTRYLFDSVLDYADRLCATLPPTLQRCFFVNSGSEANELALRLAFTHTGHRDLLVVDNAYHGHTNTLIDISPYKFMGKGGAGKPQPWVHVVPVPDGYRGPFKGQGRDTGLAYGQEVRRMIDELDRPIAGFIAESLLSCGGQVIPPEGYFETVFDHVRRAGGVCILDEVQVGFGRVGTHFWAFETQGVVPDILVMGKPMGNGHPLAAVFTTQEIADSFAAVGMEFFSTFGGNPVSCSVGTAVLDVIQEEGLQAHALEVGTYLREGLRGLMDRHPLIGDVRGLGLFIGVELVTDRTTLAPATFQAKVLVNALRQRHILVGTDGPFDNVVKLKPPMVVSRQDARMVIEAVDEILGGMVG
jgi:4-aminobutyrate aminotransferase-like enzyme/Ser/Thr protein kinase RdoA (MazF antagonist)